jgi:uncharacterized protein YbjT (DUF2867 family)
MKYVVHGATGAQGRPVLAALTAAGKQAEGLRRVAGENYESIDRLTTAYRGAKGVFVHLPLGREEDRLQFARNIVVALHEARPDRVVISTSGQIVDDPASPLQHPPGSALPTLLRGIAKSGLSHAIIGARSFLENLLLPPVIQAVRAEGVLRYPLRPDFPVSWASHLDVAVVAAALFDRTDIEGTVAVGQHPAIPSVALAQAFSARLGREVVYEAVEPEEFGALVAPLIGPAGTAAIIGRYKALATLGSFTFAPEQSAQQLLKIVPRTTLEWLQDLGL